MIVFLSLSPRVIKYSATYMQARPNLQAGAFEIVDDVLKGTFDPESMKKAASVAIRCVGRDASSRPSIAEVLTQLKEAYSLQLSYLAASGHTDI